MFYNKNTYIFQTKTNNTKNCQFIKNKTKYIFGGIKKLYKRLIKFIIERLQIKAN
jgi:hypothetical protein